MKHILGMAKRHLDLRGAKGPKLELDFLRLAIAVAQLRRAGDDAKGYLLVMTPAIRQRTESWLRKYATADAVEVLAADLTRAERHALSAEVKANIAGMIAGAQHGAAAGRSDARSGGRLAEHKLRALIEEREPGVREVKDRSRFPLDIQWDYYGTLAN